MNALGWIGAGVAVAGSLALFLVLAARKFREESPYTDRLWVRGARVTAADFNTHIREGIDLDAKDAAHRGVPDPKFDRREP